ncbi:MAG: hypothetical protein ABIJ09_03245 [Pseudomonadota bacterium]
MNKNAFEIRPVARYSGARYPGVRPPRHDEGDEGVRKPGPVRLAFTALLIAAISLGLVACLGDLRGKLQDRFDVVTSADGGGGGDGGTGDDGGDIIMGEMVECSPGDLHCDDADTLATCGDDYLYTRQSCAEICEDRFSASGEWGYSLGCDIDAADPCQCQEDMIDGGMPACFPGDVYCADDTTLVECGDDYSMNSVDCETYCDAQYGDPAAYSLGCSDDAADPCQCQYDLEMGVMAVCMPGDIACESGNVLATCADYDYQRQDCDDTCAAQGQISLGCDVNAQDPCQCEYDIAIGDVAVCTPGDVICFDEATAGVCNDGQVHDAVPCEEHCRQTQGDDYTSIGCDAQDVNNFCGCKPRQD